MLGTSTTPGQHAHLTQAFLLIPRPLPAGSDHYLEVAFPLSKRFNTKTRIPESHVTSLSLFLG